MTLDFLNSPALLLGAGGIAAAVAAGWSHVKTIWNYVSSFAFVSISISGDLQAYVSAYLYHKCYMLPSGLHVYHGRKFKLRGKEHYSMVPFRTPSPKSSIYWYGRGILFVGEGDYAMAIRSIRGLVDFDKLIKEAISFYEQRNNDGSVSRFHVHRVLGLDKSTKGMDWKQRHGGGDQDSPSALSSSESRQDHTVIDSFMYDRDEYIYSAKDKDPLDGLFFDEHVVKYFDQAERWFSMGKWYADRGIPWRRGWLLYGPGGTGKSSIAKALAKKLGMPIYQFYLATLSDNEFIEEWNRMNTPCVALLEDFDSVFNGRESTTEHRSLTFDTVLNTISGVDSLDGVMLIVTTNHLEKIDPAIGVVADSASGISTRPGRIDTVIEVSFMSQANKVRMAERMLSDWPDAINTLCVTSAFYENQTPAQWAEACLQVALTRMAQDDNKILPMVHSNAKNGRSDTRFAEVQAG